MNNRHNRIFSPKSRRPFQIRRPNYQITTIQTNRRLSTVVRHTPLRITNKAGIISTDASTQRGNIQVAVRVRPTNTAEEVSAHRTVVQVVDERMVIFDPKEDVSDFYYHGKKQQISCFKRNKDIKFVFDRVFGTSATNQEVFEGTIKRSLDTLIEGFNCSVFAYGATGSGKTFTMLGSGNVNPGLTFLTLMELYERLEALGSDFDASVCVSYLEVYNESVRDLLNTNGKGGNLNILEDENGVSVPNLTTFKPKDQTELIQLLTDGNSRRTQHPTDHNAESSRSHAVFQVLVTLRARFTNLNKSIRSAKLVMVDLAGSERGSATGFRGDRFREGASINKSLLALGNCINALADGKKHVPYRDSKLTRLLKDSLGGNCKTIIIANVSPSSLSYDDTHNTLKYANRAKHIRVNLKKNEVTVSARLAEYAKVIQEMQNRINLLTAENELYKNSCRCLTNKESSSDDESEDAGESEKENLLPKPENETRGKVVAFKNLKRRYSETKSLLQTTEAKIQMKKARLEAIDCTKDAGATKGVEKMKRQLSQMQMKRDRYANRSQHEQAEVDEQMRDAGSAENVPIPLSEVLRLKGLEVDLELLMKKQAEEREFMLQENLRTENLLARSMACLKTIHQLYHYHKHTTKEQDNEYEELRQEYLGHTKVRWADQEATANASQFSNLNPSLPSSSLTSTSVTSAPAPCLNTTFTTANSFE